MKKTVLSLEQALALPYATQRFVHLGWRVIRVESPPDQDSGRGGDPNRYIGEDTGSHDLHAYFIAPNIGKEAITLNLRKQDGQDLLKKILRELSVDVFLCNTLPKRYKQLGIDYGTLSAVKPDLIWCGISALGPEYPEAAGYDPTLQALLGYMYLTGEPDRDPMLCGLPIIDLKAGDEAFAQVLLALMEQQSTPREHGKKSGGKEIHISMAQCAASWLITALPQLEFVEDKSKLFKRSGNEHRSFIPCNCYPTKDGFVYLAIGSDSQWEKLVRLNHFEGLDLPARKTNQGRNEDKEAIYAGIRAGLRHYTTEEFIKICLAQNLSVAPVNSIQDTARLDYIKNSMLRTEIPAGRIRSLFPVPVMTDHLLQKKMTLIRAPHLGEHNQSIYKEVGLRDEDISKLHDDGVI